jgi:hypothetical protein
MWDSFQPLPVTCLEGLMKTKKIVAQVSILTDSGTKNLPITAQKLYGFGQLSSSSRDVIQPSRWVKSLECVDVSQLSKQLNL